LMTRLMPTFSRRGKCLNATSSDGAMRSMSGASSSCPKLQGVSFGDQGTQAEAQIFSYAAVKRALERRAAIAAADTQAIDLAQSGSHIRSLTEYQAFWESHSRTQPLEDSDDNVYH